ncbi:MAG: hypothetical protein WCI77_03610 [Candidatus Omnitrophota bacterium]
MVFTPDCFRRALLAAGGMPCSFYDDFPLHFLIFAGWSKKPKTTIDDVSGAKKA